jgi:glycosyltransferase involved in cell wall biosynthesis
MACGVPVITSRGSSLEEVAGDAALLVDPLDPASIIRAMQSALSDSTLREHLKQAGLKRSADFSPEQTARKTLDVYQALLGIRENSSHPMARTSTGALQGSR